jgi:hypothetical protein
LHLYSLEVTVRSHFGWTVAAVLLGLALPSPAKADSITIFTDRPTFNAAVGATTTDTFGSTLAFPITTGVLNASTNLVTADGGPILPGLIQPGVTYSTPIGTGLFFNIDSGGGFPTPFLDAGLDSQSQPITVTFANPVFGFGFDTNTLMGSAFQVTINFTAGAPFVSSALSLASSSLQFYGFEDTTGSDITSVTILGNSPVGGVDFQAAFDNFSVAGNPAGAPASGVPEPTTALLLVTGLAALLVSRLR